VIGRLQKAMPDLSTLFTISNCKAVYEQDGVWAIYFKIGDRTSINPFYYYNEKTETITQR
ncbi:hypothetical protein ACFLWX_04270, partial [Chloroflexota bacterium]